MLSRFGCAPRKKDLTITQFQEHWRISHARVVSQLVGLKRYWQNHAVLRDGETLLPWPGFDACAQIDAETMLDMDRAFLSEHYQVTVREDERRFISHAGFGMTLCECVLADGRTDGSGVRLLTFMRLAPMRAPAALAGALLDDKRTGVAKGREVYLAITGAAAGQRASLFDAVESLWFDNDAEAERQVRSIEEREHRVRLADSVRGCERLIARVNIVI
ncbi:MAG: hypothetical protein FJY55_01755 [Betaproteobacteria bacterium]|nr:hypothetical protein [Betaproteobacteria bacterium]